MEEATSPNSRGRSWTDDEVQEMIDMFHGDVKIREIANILKRSSRAVRFKLGRIGLMYAGRKANKSADGTNSSESDTMNSSSESDTINIIDDDGNEINDLIKEYFIYGMLTGTFISAGFVAFVSILKTSLLTISLQPQMQYNLEF
jgi:hypothetical protein